MIAPAPAVGAGRTPEDRVDLLIIGAVIALLVVWVPGLGLPLLTPRMAIALVMAGPGLVVVVGLIRRKDLGARWIGAFLVWALVAAVMSTQRRPALIGSYGSDIGWIWLACYVGAWGVGRRLGRSGIRLLPWALIGGVAVNAVFGILEAAFEPDGALSPAKGRVLGLVTNSLFLAGLLCGGLALLGRLSASRSPRRWALLALVVLFATAVNLTGSRAALACGAVLAVAGAVVSWRSQRASWGRAGLGGAVVALAVIIGVVLSGPLQGVESGTGRIGEVSTSSGYESRILMWGFGLDAVAEQPVTGWGPGRFREATGPRTTAAFVRAEGPERLFYDAHNLFVEHLVGEGIPGLILLIGFVVVAAKRCRGPLAWFALGVACTWMLNPVSVCTAPVALIALGASWRRKPVPPPAREDEEEPTTSVPVGRIVGAVLASVGLLLAANVVVVDRLVEVGTTSGDVEPLEQAQRLSPGDAIITGAVADARRLVADLGGESARRDVLESSRRATREDPLRSLWWVRRGYAEAQMGRGSKADRLDAAERNFQQALRLSPWSSGAMSGMRAVGEARKDQAMVDRWTERLCAINLCSEGS